VDRTSDLGIDPLAPIMFLDIDGVLNSHAWWHVRSQEDRASKSALTRDLNDLCPVACAELQYLHELWGFNLVIISTWRKYNEPSYIDELFKIRGITAPILGITPVMWMPVGIVQSGHGRGVEIQRWLRTYRKDLVPLLNICILDDDRDMSCLRTRLVHTSMEAGLLPEHRPAVREAFSKPLGAHLWEVDAMGIDARWTYTTW